jgi:hypothetical protein
MAIPLVTATFTGVDTRLKFKDNELLQIRVYSDTQFPIWLSLRIIQGDTHIHPSKTFYLLGRIFQRLQRWGGEYA